MTEPHIVINGCVLTLAQAIAVRVAITQFEMEVAWLGADLGEIAPAYRDRCREILQMMGVR